MRHRRDRGGMRGGGEPGGPYWDRVVGPGWGKGRPRWATGRAAAGGYSSRLREGGGLKRIGRNSSTRIQRAKRKCE